MMLSVLMFLEQNELSWWIMGVFRTGATLPSENQFPGITHIPQVNIIRIRSFLL